MPEPEGMSIPTLRSALKEVAAANQPVPADMLAVADSTLRMLLEETASLVTYLYERLTPLLSMSEDAKQPVTHELPLVTNFTSPFAGAMGEHAHRIIGIQRHLRLILDKLEVH